MSRSRTILATCSRGENNATLFAKQSGTGMWVQREPSTFTGSLAFSPTENCQAVGSNDGRIDLRTPDGKDVTASMSIGGDFAVNSVDFSSDGKLLASTSNDQSTRLWDVRTRRLLQRWEHPDRCDVVRFSPDSTLLAIGTCFREIQIVDVVSRRQRRSIEINGDNKSLAWSPNGQYLAAGQTNGGIALYDAANHRTTRLQSGYLPILALTFSPDGTTLLSGEGSGAIRMWHVETGRSLGAINHTPTHLVAVSGLFFSANPDQLIATYYGPDGVVVWSLDMQ